jgi:monoamine oxidase
MPDLECLPRIAPSGMSVVAPFSSAGPFACRIPPTSPKSNARAVLFLGERYLGSGRSPGRLQLPCIDHRPLQDKQVVSIVRPDSRVIAMASADNVTEEYLTLLERGVGEYRRQTKCNVAIVGAGIAGLVAGWLLQRAGVTVTVYEASSRVGGRVRTLRDRFSSGLYAEAGAMRIPTTHRLTLWLCNHFGLDMIDFVQEDDATLVYVNGERSKRSDYKNGLCTFGEPYKGGRSADQITDLVVTKALKETYLHEDQAIRLTLDDLSWGEYLRAFITKDENPITGEKILPEQRLTSADIDLVGFERGAADLKASLLETIRDHMTILGPKKQIKGGMDCLPKKFVDPAVQNNLANAVRYNCRVTEITSSHRDRGYHIALENTSTGYDLTHESTDHVVLAAPFSALTHVRLGLLSPKRRHAIRNLHYENAAKIVLEFEEAFWTTKFGIKGGYSFTDLPIRWTYYPSPDQYSGTTRALLLASYTWGDDSLRWGSLSPADRIRFALRDVAELHKMSETECRRLLVGGDSHSWASDEYTFGAFALFEPHQERDLFADTWKPEGCIHFAGEHTSLKHAWIEGAVESGIRVAREIVVGVHHHSQS